MTKATDFFNNVVQEGSIDGIDWCVVAHQNAGEDEYQQKNGYVHVPSDHPWSGLSYDEVQQRFDINVHGGLTFADKNWFGFDTAQVSDAKIVPVLEDDELRWTVGEGHRWTVAEVVAETEKLARQATLAVE